MASAGVMTPPTGGRNPSWARAVGASKMAMTKMAMTKNASKNARCDASIRIFLTLQHIKARSLCARHARACPGHDGNKSTDFLCPWGKAKHHRSRDAAGIRGVGQAAPKRHEAFAFERPLSEAGGGVRPVILIQARKAKKEKRKK